MKIEYRRLVDGDTWHSKRTCSNDPQKGFVVVFLKLGIRPKDGEMCNECLAKEKD